MNSVINSEEPREALWLNEYENFKFFNFLPAGRISVVFIDL